MRRAWGNSPSFPAKQAGYGAQEPLREPTRHQGRSLLTGPASVVPLGEGRWHIGLGPAADGCRAEWYLSPEDGGLLAVTGVNGRLDIRLHGAVSAGSVRNLGDCLLAGLAEGVALFVLWLDRAEGIGSEAGGLFESLGRHLAREDAGIRLEIHGGGPAREALLAAFRQGLGRSGRPGGQAS